MDDTAAATDLQLDDDPQQHRYEARVDGVLAAIAEYRLEADRIVFTHTEVGDDFEGQGVGSRLVRHALDDARARGLGVVPRCPFVRAYVDRHPELADLVVDASS